MGKSKELKTTTEIVKYILETVPPTRNSDSYLIVKVYEYINPKTFTMSFSSVMNNLKEYGLPSTETIRRCRQKLQAAYPELAGCDDVEGQRIVNEQIFRDYARGMV